MQQPSPMFLAGRMSALHCEGTAEQSLLGCRYIVLEIGLFSKTVKDLNTLKQGCHIEHRRWSTKC